MKKPFIYLLTAGLAFSMITNTGVTYASEESDEQAAQSKATITFSAPKEAVGPYNPTKPTEKVKEEDKDKYDGEMTGNAGPLSLDYVSNIRFNEQDEDGDDIGLVITSETKQYETASEAPYIQVSDFTGTGNGWNVTARAERFKSSEEDTLKGATISFINGDAVSTSEDINNKPKVEQDIELETGEESALVVSAESRTAGEELTSAQGIGTWLMRWFETGDEAEGENSGKVILEVPGGTASEGLHTSTIHWTLSNGPETQQDSGQGENSDI